MLITKLYKINFKGVPTPFGIKAKTLQEAKDKIAIEPLLDIYSTNITFKNGDREYYTFKNEGRYTTGTMSVTGEYYDTKQGARRLLSKTIVKNDNGYSYTANDTTKNGLWYSTGTKNTEGWFTTGLMREGNYYEVITTDKKKRGWISGVGASFGAEWWAFTTETTKPYVKPTTTTQTTTTPIVKPTQIIVPVVVKPTVKPTVKPLINQGYDNTFFVVEPPKEEKSNILPILGLLISAITLLK